MHLFFPQDGAPPQLSGPTSYRVLSCRKPEKLRTAILSELMRVENIFPAPEPVTPTTAPTTTPSPAETRRQDARSLTTLISRVDDMRGKMAEMKELYSSQREELESTKRHAEDAENRAEELFRFVDERVRALEQGQGGTIAGGGGSCRGLTGATWSRTGTSTFVDVGRRQTLDEVLVDVGRAKQAHDRADIAARQGRAGIAASEGGGLYISTARIRGGRGGGNEKMQNAGGRCVT